MTAIVRTQVVEGWNLAYAEGEDEPRVSDLEVAEALGYADPRDIRELIERHANALKRGGDLPWVRAEQRKNKFFPRNVEKTRNTSISSTGAGPGRQAKVYMLNEYQAITVAVLSQTPRADDVRHALITTFMAARRGMLPQPSRLDAAADVILRAASNPERFRGGAELRDNTEFARQCKNLLGSIARLEQISWNKAHGDLRRSFGVVSYLRIPIADFLLVREWLVGRVSTPPTARALVQAKRQLELFERILREREAEGGGEPH